MSTPLKTTHLLIITPLAFFAVTLLTDPQIARAETAYSSRCMTTPGFEYNDGDTDKDGLKDWEEDRNHNCRLDPGETVPYLPFDGYLSYYPDRPVPADATDEVKLAMAKDTDGDGIDDLHEYFRNETAHRDYVTAVGVFAAEEQRITRNDTERTPLLTPEQKNAIFRCPEATNPFDCDGDGRGNANDREADGDGIPDRLENCNLDPEGYVAGARYWDPDRGEGGALVQGIPDSNSSTEAGSLCTADERLVDFFVGVSYLWQETDPYSSDTDGDGIPEGRVEPGKDLCPNAEGGEILSGADGTRKGFGEEAAAADFTCVKALCKPALFSKLPGTWDTDVDGRTDKIEDVDGSCAVYRGEASTESDPYKYNTDGGDKNNDLLRDGEDPCPLNSDTRCAYVCKPGGFGDPADPTKGMHVGHMTTVNRGEKDYDGDTLYDITEDVDGDCEYTGPSDLKGAKGRAGVSKETNWRDADTDHDAYEYDAGGNPVGDPLFDITLGPQQARGTDQYDRCPHLNPDDDETNGWPHCLRHYCSSASDERGLGRLNYTITESGNADGDGLSDAQEDKNGNCRYDAARVEFGETVSRETNWLEPDSDFDGIPDLRDACGSQPEIWRADDYDGDGLTNGEEDADHDCFVDPFETDPYVAEVDENGFEDRDRQCRTNRDMWKELDSDRDGLKNGDEDANPNCELDQLETSPYSSDTDGDGIPDGDDTCRHPTLTLHERWVGLDADNDGLPNGDEDANGNCQVDQFETDPYNADTDGDGFQDRDDSCGHPKLRDQWKTRDADGDGLTNGDEDADGNCQVGPYESDPFKSDTDGDGRNDFEDPCAYSADIACLTRCSPGTSFASAETDSDGDGLKDVEEDSNKNCIFFGIGESDPFDTSLYVRDSDGDGLSDRVDGCQMRPDGSGILPSVTVPVTIEEETCARQQCLSATGRNPGALKDSDRDGIPDIMEDPDFDCVISSESETDRFNADTDGDGLPDGVEDSNKNGTVEIDAEKGTGETNPRNADTDGDGIPDGVEDGNQNGRYDYGELNPRMPDTDKDGILDGFEDRNKNGLWEGGQLLPTGPCRLVDDTGAGILDLTGNPLVPETSGYLNDSDLDGIPDGAEDVNKNGEFTNIGARFKPALMPEGGAISIEEITEFGESNPCDNDTDGDGLFDGKEDLDGDGVLDWKEGETSPISPHTFGEPDSSRLERRLGMSGCSLIPEK